MIVESILIKNWRTLREPHEFRFDAGVNLLVGPNEAGKSTLFEALARGFFDRHNAKSEEIRQIQPLGSSLTPEVVIVFSHGGSRYRLLKQFLHNPRAELSTERSGKWELDHEGDEADSFVRELLDGSEFGRATKAEHRGIAHALWYLQSEPPLPEKAWSTALQDGLSGLVNRVIRSPDESKILEAIEAEYLEYWTDKGRESSRGELADLRAKKPAIEQGLARATEALESAAVLRRDVESFSARLDDKERALEGARARLDTATQAAEEADTHEQDVLQKQSELDSTKIEHSRLKEERAAIRRREDKIRNGRAELPKKQTALSNKGVAVARELGIAQQADQQRKEELVPQIDELEAQVIRFEALHKARKLEKERAGLAERVTKLDAARKEAKRKRDEFNKLVAPTKPEWTKFQGTVDELRTAEAKATTAGIIVSFDLKDDQLVSSQPVTSRQADGTYVVTQPTTFKIKGIGSVGVRGGGDSLEEIHAALRDAKLAHDAWLKRFSSKSAAELSDLVQSRLTLETEVKALERRVTEFEGDAPPDDELARVERGIAEELAISKGVLAEAMRWGGQQIRSHIDGLMDAKKRKIREIRVTEDRAEAARAKHLELVKEETELQQGLTELSTQLASFAEENANALKKYSTLDHLDELIASAHSRNERAARELASLVDATALKVEAPRRALTLVKNEISQLGTDIDSISHDVTDRMARIEQEAARGIYGQAADLELELAALNGRFATLSRRADAVKLLRELIRELQAKESAALTGPIADIMQRWLQQVTDGGYGAVELDESLVPTGLAVPRYGAILPMQSLSFGTREQVVLMLRLAMGVLLSEKSRHLVILDDRLVNADLVRMQKLCAVLAEASGKCQILIAACNDTPYAGLGVKAIEVPASGRLNVAT